MTKLFLVRRGLHTFVGPLTLSEFRTDFKRMAFGVQDEVSGHGGPWIILENADRLARYYPEVARVVHDDISESWRLSDHSGKRITGGSKAQQSARKETQKTVLLAFAFLCIAVGAALAAMWLAGGSGAFSSKSSDAAGSVTVAQVASALSKVDTKEFVAMMQNNLTEIVARHNRNKEGGLEWLPYLRAYAFLVDGHVEGISPKTMRGGNAALAPVDCSEKSWRKRWKESTKTWGAFVSGKNTVRAPWARLLAWDPHWIRRRSPKGWILPRNYYEGCVQQAYKSFINLKTDATAVSEGIDVNSPEFLAIGARLKWLVDTSFAMPSLTPDAVEKDNVLSLWTCYESADSIGAIAQCYESIKISEASLAYNDERIAAALLRLTIKANAADQDVVAELRARFAMLQGGDSFTRTDYSSELRFVRSVLKVESIPDATASEKAPADYTDVNFAK